MFFCFAIFLYVLSVCYLGKLICDFLRTKGKEPTKQPIAQERNFSFLPHIAPTGISMQTGMQSR